MSIQVTQSSTEESENYKFKAACSTLIFFVYMHCWTTNYVTAEIIVYKDHTLADGKKVCCYLFLSYYAKHKCLKYLSK